MNFLFWPYDELEMNYNQNGNELGLSLPWIKLNVTLEEAKSQELMEIKEKIGSEDVKPADIKLLSEFLENFKEYPVLYILPSEKKGDLFNIVDQKLLDQSPLATLEAMAQIASPTLEAIQPDNIQKIMDSMEMTEFKWDTDAAIEFSSLGGKVHPESLLTVARRYFMLDVMDHKEVGNVYNKIRGLNKDKQAFAAASMVRQNHYVTQNCLGAVTPALDNAQSAKKHVEAFIKEESGHDRILNKSLEAMGFKQDELSVSLNTQATMDLLKFAAQRNFLAFAIAIDFFERSNYSETDPLADLLTDIGFEKSASFINKHLQINDDGGHELMSFEFLATMGGCSKDYAREALIITELLSQFMNNVVQQTYAQIEKNV